MAKTKQVTFAPGARVLIRDEEWMVRATLPVQAGAGSAVQVVGLSELVKQHEAVFLTDLDVVAELRPEDTQLVHENSPQYRKSRLYLESLLRRTPPTDAFLYLGHQAAINYVPYQAEPTHQALTALRPRILIADGVGLGKTVEVGILLSELMKRGRANRILVVAIRSMLAQFQEELWARFAIPLVRLDSVGLQRVRAKIPANKNPFTYYNRVIISVDTLKNDAQYRHYLEQCHWDVIVIDECHNVANTGSDRNRLAMLLARTCDSLLLTSATPHNGRAESFANLMNMLEPTAIADRTNYTAEEIAGMFVRRFKKDIEDQVGDQFSTRTVDLVKGVANSVEETFFEVLSNSKFHTLTRGSNNDALYRIGVLKAFLSSPLACLETLAYRFRQIRWRLAKLQGESLDNEEEAEAELKGLEEISDELVRQQRVTQLKQDANQLWQLIELVWRLYQVKQPTDKLTSIHERLLRRLGKDSHRLLGLHGLKTADSTGFSKYGQLVALLARLGVDGSAQSPRVIIFSERIATLYYLQAQLMAEFGVDEAVIPVFEASLGDTEQMDLVDSFGKLDSPIRVLLASDVASEGVNLHYYCHLMIHFDIPWSLITLEQRNGRIDRYGQHEPPQIFYLLTVAQYTTTQSDLRVLDKLIEKEQEAHKNIGDAATILGLHDAQKEEDYITQKVAEGLDPAMIIPDVSEEIDLLAMLMGEMAHPKTTTPIIRDPLTLYQNDIVFAKAAFEELHSVDSTLPLPEGLGERDIFTLFAPPDLRHLCEFMPQEAVPNDWEFKLTTSRARVIQSMADSRRLKNRLAEAKRWPEYQLFWELHPVMTWLIDRLMVRFGRHEAPLIIAPTLGDNYLYLFQGTLSNRRSQPVITEWFGLLAQGKQWQPLTFAEVMGRTRFAEGIPNLDAPSLLQKRLQERLPQAVEAAKDYMTQQEQRYLRQNESRLLDDQAKLDQWHGQTVARLNGQLKTAMGVQAVHLNQELNETEKLYQARQTWLTEIFSPEPTPYLRLVATFSGK